MSHKSTAWPAVVLVVSLCQFTVAGQERPTRVHGATGLVFGAEATKSSYVKGEPVEFTFVLRNVGDHPLVVARRLQLTLNVQLKISDSQGKPAEWCGRIADQVLPLKSRYRVLASGQSVEAKLMVSCVHESDWHRAWGYKLNTPGKYLVEASYRLPQPEEYFRSMFPDAHVVRGPVSAAPLTIEIE